MKWKTIKDEVRRYGFMEEEDFTAEYTETLVDWANDAMLDIALTNGRIYKTYNFVHRPAVNQLSLPADVIFTHRHADITYKAPAALSYFFELSGNGRVIIRDGKGAELVRLDCSTGPEFEQFRGFINASEGASITFGGEYLYSFRNVALYDFKVSEYEEDIPAFGKMAAYDIEALTRQGMEKSFISFAPEGCVRFNGTFLDESHYFIRDGHIIYIPAEADGAYSVRYCAYPKRIPACPSDTYTLDIGDQYAALIPLFIASRLYKDEDVTKAAMYYNEYQQLKSTLYNENEETVEWKTYYEYER